MYDFKLNKNEEIKIISDDVVIYTKDDIKKLTCVITNRRLLMLNYPSEAYNSAEDLRISGKMNYVRKKEIVEAVNLDDIVSIIKENDYYRIILTDGRYINLYDDNIIKYLRELNNE